MTTLPVDPFHSWPQRPAPHVERRALELAASVVEAFGRDPMTEPAFGDGDDSPELVARAFDQFDAASFELYVLADGDEAMFGEQDVMTDDDRGRSAAESIVWHARWRCVVAARPDVERARQLLNMATIGLPARAASFAPRHVAMALDMFDDAYEAERAEAEAKGWGPLAAPEARARLEAFAGVACGLS